MSKRYNSPWRQMAAAIFEKPRDGKISGIRDFNMDEVSLAMKEWNEQGHRITYTHVFMSMMGRALAEYAPELNAHCQWGNTIARKDVVVSTAVSVNGKDLTTVKIHQADQKSIFELAKETSEFVQARRSGQDDKAMGSRNTLAKIPWPLRKWVYKSLHWTTYELGLELPGTGLSKDMFGSVLISNIGSLGVEYGIPALMPASNLSFVFAIGKAHQKPVIRDGEVVPAMILPVAATFDHRVADGHHISKLVKGLDYYAENPRELEQPKRA